MVAMALTGRAQQRAEVVSVISLAEAVATLAMADRITATTVVITAAAAAYGTDVVANAARKDSRTWEVAVVSLVVAVVAVVPLAAAAAVAAEACSVAGAAAVAAHLGVAHAVADPQAVAAVEVAHAVAAADAGNSNNNNISKRHYFGGAFFIARVKLGTVFAKFAAIPI